MTLQAGDDLSDSMTANLIRKTNEKSVQIHPAKFRRA
jgi:hypothetical protein